MLRNAAREGAFFAFFLAAAVAMTWPLGIRLSTALSDLGDPIGNTWILNWVCHALTHAPLQLFDSPLYVPSRLPLAFSENLIGVAIAVLPFHLAGAAPVTVYNIALLLGFAFSGYGAFVLARMLTGSIPGALVAGIVFAFVGWKFDHLSHMQLQWSGWIPLLLAAVIAYWRAPSTRGALLIAAAFVMNGLTNIHYFLFGSFAAVTTVLVLAEKRDRRFWLQLAGAFVLGGLVLLPVLLPYRIVANEYRMRRDKATARSGSAHLSAWLVATPRSAVYGKLPPPELQKHEMQLWPGLVAIALALWSAAPWRRTPRQSGGKPPHSIAILWLMIGVLGSLGMHAFFHSLLYRNFPVFQAIRAPVRWAVIAYLGLAILAAFGVMRIKRRPLALAMIPLALVDLWPRIRWEHVVADTPPAYRWLAKTNIEPLIEVPAGGGNEFRYALGSAAHHRKQFNGIENLGHPIYRRIRTKADAGQYDKQLVDLLEANGCKLIVVHAHGLAQKEWLRDPRLAFLRNFDHEIGGDFVFAVKRNLPDWQQFKAPHQPDGAGHFPDERLARMLDGRPIHSDAIMAVVESRRYGETISGKLHVHGWTLSPFTIKRVTVLLDSGRTRIDAAMSDRPDVVQRFGWYYFVPRPGFTLVIDRRPAGVPRSTDIQIEIEDEGGRITRTEDVLFEWAD
jgi:hypothetical protein